MEQPPIQQNLHQASSARAFTAEHHHAVGTIGLIAAFSLSLVVVFSYMASVDAAQASAQSALAVTTIVAEEAPITEFDGIRLIGQGAIVLDVTTGKTLFESNADAQLPLASLTKVPLMLTIAEVLSQDALVSMPYTTSPTVDAGILYEGTRWKVSDLADFMLVASSNEVARVLASIADAPLREKYPDLEKGNAAVSRMQKVASELGLSQTFFVNVTGLDESTRQAGSYGSARDMATLFAFAAEKSDLFKATHEESVRIKDINGISAVARNTNDALPRIPDLLLGKTGYTSLAGGNLAVVFEVKGHRIAAVILGSTKEGRFTDITRLSNATQRYFANQ